MSLLSKTQMILPMLELNLLQTEAWPTHSFTLPKLQAHRGFWSEGLQENTLESLMAAKKLGFEMAEFDVQLSRDQVPVLFHDLDLSRIAKKNVLLNQLEASSLKELANVVTLGEVLSNREVPEYLNIEIKSGKIGPDPLLPAVVNVIRKQRAQSRVVISSFNPWCLIKLKRMIPEVPLALLASPERVRGNAMYLRRMWTTPLLRPHALHLDYRMLDQQFLSLMKNKDLRVAAWTVNDLDKAQRLIEAGVRSVITDKNFIGRIS